MSPVSAQAGRLDITIHNLSTGAVLGTGPLRDILDCRIEQAIDEIGRFDFLIPATDPNVAQLSAGKEIRIFREEDGELFRGIVDDLDYEVLKSGEINLRVHGWSLALELDWLPTYLGIPLDDVTVSAALTSILADATGWTRLVTGAGYLNVSERLEHMTLWAACKRMAASQNAYIRETATVRELEIKNTSGDSGIVLMNLAGTSPAMFNNNAFVAPIASLGIKEIGGGIKNRIAPLGIAGGNLIFDLGQSNRASPYAIQSFLKNPPSVTNTASAAFTTPSLEAFEEFVLSINCVGRNPAIVVAYFVESTDTDVHPRDGVKVNGIVAMRQRSNNVSTSWHMAVYTALAKPGLNTIGISMQPIGAGGGVAAFMIAVALQDVLQTSGNDFHRDAQQAEGTSTTPSVTVTSVVDDLVIDFMSHVSGTETPGAGQTEILDLSTAVAEISVSTELAVGASTVMSWTKGTSNLWGTIALSIQPQPTYYIEDATSVTAYGRRVAEIIENASKLVGATTAQLQSAANTLYDLASTRILRERDPLTFYRAAPAYIPTFSWLPGDSMRLLFRGIVQDADGPRVWKDIDDTVFILRKVQRFDKAGVRSWELGLGTVYKPPESDPGIVADMMSRIAKLEAVA